MKRYENLDGLRAYACIGIILMHVLSFGTFGITGFVYERIIPSFTHFTALFMMVSAFSMCCGYYEKFQTGNVSIEDFYKKRIKRIWPFFALFCTIELIVNHDLNSLYEWFADITLVFGLIPNHGISVVGVGWFIGTIFVFYMIFPFYIFLLKSKIRAWIAMAVSVLLHILCMVRFTDANTGGNIVYSSMYFMGGGLIYLYRDKFNQKTSLIAAATAVIATVFYYSVSNSSFVRLLVFSSLLICIIPGGVSLDIVFHNKAVKLIATVSMEMFICQMFAFHVCEKVGISRITSNMVINYWLTSVGTIIGAYVIAFVGKRAIALLMLRQEKNR